MTGSVMRVAAVMAVLGTTLAACGADEDPVADDQAVTIAFLRAAPAPGGDDEQEAFLGELADAGYEVGRNLGLIAADPAEAHPDPDEAAELAARWEREGRDLIVALSSTGAAAAAGAAPGTDILFISNDPTATGLVDDERHPEGNLTGVTFRVPADRLLDLARQVVPGLETVGILVAGGDPASGPSRDAAVEASEELDLGSAVAVFEGEDEVAGAVGELVTAGADLVLLTNSPTVARSVPAIQAAAAPTGLPLIAATSVADSALLVLEPDTTELYRQLGRQAGRLLSGVEASEVPVEDPARFRLVLNAGVADALGLRIPPALLEQADRVIS